jgi:hypothetical protein
MMSWSLAKEASLRRLVARGVKYSDGLGALSSIEDAKVDEVEADLLKNPRPEQPAPDRLGGQPPSEP